MKDYGQFCGLAKASSLIGERWALLVLRDLSVTPRRFKDLHEGLPGIPTSLLTRRLRELEEVGVITRRASRFPGAGVLYLLTAYGRDFIPVLDEIGRWGAQGMAILDVDGVMSDASLAAALRAGFRYRVLEFPVTYLVHAGLATAWVIAGPDHVKAGVEAPAAQPELVISGDKGLRQILAGQVSPAEAVAADGIRMNGPQELFEIFVRAFHVPIASDRGAE